SYSGLGAAGVDGVWFTADDVPSSYKLYLYDTNGNQSQVATYSGAGIDGIWFTADDVKSTETLYTMSF
ncbi:MAG: hypothetical protein WA632_09925, partial [Gallionella sp.]